MESERPSQLDLGKDIYGRPFLKFDVEAVKAFLRIVVIFLCLFGFYSSVYIAVEYDLPYINIYKGMPFMVMVHMLCGDVLTQWYYY